MPIGVRFGGSVSGCGSHDYLPGLKPKLCYQLINLEQVTSPLGESDSVSPVIKWRCQIVTASRDYYENQRR